jgi:hypothetical protein
LGSLYCVELDLLMRLVSTASYRLRPGPRRSIINSKNWASMKVGVQETQLRAAQKRRAGIHPKKTVKRVGHDMPETRARLFRQYGALPQNAITLINWWIETEIQHERAANRPGKHFARLFYEDGLYPDFMMRLVTERTEKQTTRTVVLARIKIEDELRGQGHFTTLRETLEGIAIRIGGRLQVEQANSDMSSRLMRHGYVRLDPYGKPEADNPKFSGSWWWPSSRSLEESAAVR